MVAGQPTPLRAFCEIPGTNLAYHATAVATHYNLHMSVLTHNQKKTQKK